MIKGLVSVANIVDKVDIGKEKYRISSTGALGAVLFIVPQDQKLIRDSVGMDGTNGVLTNAFQEKRCNTELLIARVERNTLNFS